MPDLSTYQSKPPPRPRLHRVLVRKLLALKEDAHYICSRVAFVIGQLMVDMLDPEVPLAPPDADPKIFRPCGSPDIVGPAGIEWNTWYRHRAYLVVTPRPSGEDHPPDTTALAARKVVLRERAIGRDGWRDAPPTVVVVVVLRKVSKVWRVDSDEPS